jgi:hypothetical protein
MRKLALLLCCALVTLCAAMVACNSSSKPTLTQGDVQQFQSASSSLQTAVATYRAQAQTMTDASCATVEAEYEHGAQPAIDDMSKVSGEMDDFMRSHGRNGSDDVSCGCDAMKAELEHHKSVACTGNVANDKPEAERHASQMSAYVEHQSVHADEAMGMMMDGGAMEDAGVPLDGGTAMGMCYRAPSGEYEMDGGVEVHGDGGMGVDGGHM